MFAIQRAFYPIKNNGATQLNVLNETDNKSRLSILVPCDAFGKATISAAFFVRVNIRRNRRQPIVACVFTF